MINKTGLNFQAQMDAMNRNQIAKPGEKATLASRTASGGDTQVNKDNKTKTTESLDQATLDRLNQLSSEKQAETEGKASVADNAAQSNKARDKKETGKTSEDLDYGPGELETKTSSGYTFVDEADEAIEIPKDKAKALESLDDKRHAERILADMPEANRTAASAMLSNQIQTNGEKKVAQLKDDPKVSVAVEEMDLEPAETLKEAAKPAPIKSAKDEKPMLLDDPFSEGIAKEAAAQQLASGANQEQMIA